MIQILKSESNITLNRYAICLFSNFFPLNRYLYLNIAYNSHAQKFSNI